MSYNSVKKRFILSLEATVVNIILPCVRAFLRRVGAKIILAVYVLAMEIYLFGIILIGDLEVKCSKEMVKNADEKFDSYDMLSK